MSRLCHGSNITKTTNGATSPVVIVWEYTGSNRGPSACKADALNQLSYTPNFFVSMYSSNRGPSRHACFLRKRVRRDALNQLSYTPFLKSGVQT